MKTISTDTIYAMTVSYYVIEVTKDSSFFKFSYRKHRNEHSAQILKCIKGKGKKKNNYIYPIKINLSPLATIGADLLKKLFFIIINSE